MASYNPPLCSWHTIVVRTVIMATPIAIVLMADTTGTITADVIIGIISTENITIIIMAKNTIAIINVGSTTTTGIMTITIAGIITIIRM